MADDPRRDRRCRRRLALAGRQDELCVVYQQVSAYRGDRKSVSAVLCRGKVILVLVASWRLRPFRDVLATASHAATEVPLPYRSSYSLAINDGQQVHTQPIVLQVDLKLLVGEFHILRTEGQECSP